MWSPFACCPNPLGKGATAPALQFPEGFRKHHHLLLLFLVPDHNSSQLTFVLPLSLHTRQPDDLVMQDLPLLRHNSFFDYFVNYVVLHLSYEPDALSCPAGEQSEVRVSPIDSDYAASS